jgi:hypothetical protein
MKPFARCVLGLILLLSSGCLYTLDYVRKDETTEKDWRPVDEAAPTAPGSAEAPAPWPASSN